MLLLMCLRAYISLYIGYSNLNRNFTKQICGHLIFILGDDNAHGFTAGDVYFAQVKKCPHCRHPMEKDGGCQHISCRCGHGFCWECLQDWNKHDWDICVKRHAKEQVTQLTCSYWPDSGPLLYVMVW